MPRHGVGVSSIGGVQPFEHKARATMQKPPAATNRLGQQVLIAEAMNCHRGVLRLTRKGSLKGAWGGTAL